MIRETSLLFFHCLEWGVEIVYGQKSADIGPSFVRLFNGLPLWLHFVRLLVYFPSANQHDACRANCILVFVKSSTLSIIQKTHSNIRYIRLDTKCHREDILQIQTTLILQYIQHNRLESIRSHYISWFKMIRVKSDNFIWTELQEINSFVDHWRTYWGKGKFLVVYYEQTF